jgi:hypothetical protein
MSAASPRPLRVEDVERDVADIARFAERVLDAYRWLHSSGYARSVRSTGAGGTDPASLALSGEHEAVHHQLGSAAANVRRAARSLHAADSALARAFAVIDRRAPASRPDERLDHPASRAELRHAEQAQERRNERMRLHASPWAAEEVTG